MIDLGTLPGGANSQPYAINEPGVVVGVSDTAALGCQHAFLYSGSEMSDLGVLPGDKYSYALDVNNSGVVVGVSYSAANNGRAFYSFGKGPMVDLNSLVDPSLGWQLQIANAISASGEIFGFGYHAGHYSAFRVTVPALYSAGR